MLRQLVYLGVIIYYVYIYEVQVVSYITSYI
jgi:hypothetical protein